MPPGQVPYTHTGLYDQVIQVSMDGYDDWKQTVNASTTKLLVNLSRKTLTFTVHLYDSDTLSPKSPGGLSMSLLEIVTQMKPTDSSGTSVFAVNATTMYSVDLSAPNYQSRSEIVNMGTENQEVTVETALREQFLVLCDQG